LSRDGYDSIFAHALKTDAVRIDGSTHYLRSDVATSRILEDAPDARFVVCLRNPVDMYRSLHGHRLFHGVETEVCPERAWNLQSERQKGKYIPSWIADPSQFDYASMCSLGAQVDRLLQIVVRKRVHFVLLEDIAHAPRSSYEEVMSFLGVDATDIDLSARNITQDRKSHSINQAISWARFHLRGPIGRRLVNVARAQNARLNTTTAQTSKLRPGFRKELIKIFKTDVALLSERIGRDLSHWGE